MKCKRSETQAWANAKVVFDARNREDSGVKCWGNCDAENYENFDTGQNLKERRRLRANRCALRLLALRPRLSGLWSRASGLWARFSGLWSRSLDMIGWGRVDFGGLDENAMASELLTGRGGLSGGGVLDKGTGTNETLVWLDRSAGSVGEVGNGTNGARGAQWLRRAILGLALVLVGSFGLQTSYVSAASLTLTVPGAIKLEVNPGTSETFSKSSVSSIGVKTDAAFGYDLSIKVKDGANGNSLVNGSNKLSSISANLSEESYKAAGNDNTWGYLPSKVNSSDNTEFLPGPTTSLTVLDKTSAKNDADNNYSVTLAAKVDQTVPTGNYTNTFVFTAAANTVSYSITYDLNSGSGGPSPNPQTGTTSSGTIKLDSTAPTREGYEFKGWCTVSTSDENCSGTTYQPGADYPLQNNSNNLTLWAMWKSAGPTNLGNLGNMQSFNCSKITNTEDYGTVTDTRDNNKYTVAKLKDGKCWMTQNLKIAGKTITSSDSDVSSSFTIPSSSISKFDVGIAGYTNTNNSAAYVDSTYGGYYTWYTVTAGTGTSSMTTENQNATGSICPKGWKLPTSGSDTNSSDFGKLVTAYGGNNSTGSSNLTATPVPGFTYTGNVNYYGGYLGLQGSYGEYWSSTVFDSTFVYYLVLTSSSANPADYLYRVDGYSVRCVAR